MAAKRKSKPDEEPVEATESPPEETEQKNAPKPRNAAILNKGNLIRVKANRPIGEQDQEGQMRRYVKGDEFYIDAARAKALGSQVTTISTEG